MKWSKFGGGSFALRFLFRCCRLRFWLLLRLFDYFVVAHVGLSHLFVALYYFWLPVSVIGVTAAAAIVTFC